MVVVERVGQPSAVLLSRNTHLHFKVSSQSVGLDAGTLTSLPQEFSHKVECLPAKAEKVDGEKTSLGKSLLLF